MAERGRSTEIMAVGFVLTHGKGKWETFAEDPKPWGGFMSDLLQSYLFPYFEINGLSVDPYDGASFSGHDLPLLIERLKTGIVDISARENPWPLKNDQLVNYYQSGRNYGIELLPPKDQSIQILNRALDLAKLAHARGESLLFIGD